MQNTYALKKLVLLFAYLLLTSGADLKANSLNEFIIDN